MTPNTTPSSTISGYSTRPQDLRPDPLFVEQFQNALCEISYAADRRAKDAEARRKTNEAPQPTEDAGTNHYWTIDREVHSPWFTSSGSCDRVAGPILLTALKAALKNDAVARNSRESKDPVTVLNRNTDIRSAYSRLLAYTAARLTSGLHQNTAKLPDFATFPAGPAVEPQEKDYEIILNEFPTDSRNLAAFHFQKILDDYLNASLPSPSVLANWPARKAQLQRERMYQSK